MRVDHNMDSDQIAPVGMYTDAWDWRLSLKKNDAIDTCDEYHSWFRGHITARRECTGEAKGVDCEGKPLEEVCVALRYADSVYGTKKVANDDQLYVGWLSKFDSWRSLTCTSIMPPGSVHTPYI